MISWNPLLYSSTYCALLSLGWPPSGVSKTGIVPVTPWTTALGLYCIPSGLPSSLHFTRCWILVYLLFLPTVFSHFSLFCVFFLFYIFDLSIHPRNPRLQLQNQKKKKKNQTPIYCNPAHNKASQGVRAPASAELGVTCLFTWVPRYLAWFHVSGCIVLYIHA